ncbi:MAG: hypothetical protein FWF29_13085, partial [Treponema sp.]|nr:hypothetical protein [Treponema sp.]
MSFLFFLFLAAPSLYAGGRTDQDMSRADTLIADKQYDEAIRILSDFSKKNPERFAEAQDRLQKIYKIREEYNTIADEVLNEVTAAEPDMDKILALTNRMEELEGSNNPTVLAFIARIRELALFNHNRQRLGQILAAGRVQLDQGDYDGALQTYYGGMDIYRDEFFHAGYDKAIVDRINAGIANIDSVVNSFARTSAPLGQASADLIQAVNQNVPSSRVTELYGRLTDSMSGIINLQQLLYQTSGAFDDQLLKFQAEDNTIGDRNFLSFASRLIQGRTNETIQEGMLGALEGYWNKSVMGVGEVLQNKADTVYAAGLTSAYNHEFAGAQQVLQDVLVYSQLQLGLLAKNREMSSDAEVVQLLNQNILPENLGNYLKYGSMYAATQYLINGAQIGVAIDNAQAFAQDTASRWSSGSIAAAEALNREQSFRGSLDTVNGNLDALLAQVNQKDTEFRNYQTQFGEKAGANPQALPYIQNAQVFIANLRSLVTGDQQQSVIRYYTIANGELEKRVNARKDQFSEGSRLMAGVENTTDAGTTVTSFYPTEALASLTAMAQSLPADIQDANTLLSRYSTEPQDFLSNQEISGLRASTQSMVNDLTTLRTNGQTLSASARNQITQADAYRLDGQRNYQEAQNALNQQNFDVARDRVARAAEQYNNSLAIQESASIRNTLYPQVESLGRDINRIENEVVIKDVRN